MKSAAKQIGACALALLLFCILTRFIFPSDYMIYEPIRDPAEKALNEGEHEAVSDHPEVARSMEIRIRDGYVQIPVHPEGRGEVEIVIRDRQGIAWASRYLRVSPLKTVYDMQTGGFTNDNAVLIAVTLFWLLVSAIMMWHYFLSTGPAYYAYSTIYFSGFSLFALVSGGLMLRVTVLHIIRPAEFSMLAAYRVIQGASRQFMMVTTPLILLFALAMIISNIALLRHMTPRLQNVLGIIVGVILIGGESLGWYLFTCDFVGSEFEFHVQETLHNVYATIFVYFECMLVGSAICGIHAARNQPQQDKDFIVILGCWFRRDGSLPPLLRGRVDRAIEFWKAQKEATGKEAILIPSGGQGRDETMPEAEAMKRYLLEKQIPEEMILPETASLNTYQNMANARAIMEKLNPEGKVVFATTNYHVFRSGVWAAQAGLRAEGIGSRTIWWFWPNAFMRECLGLLQRRWKQEILLLILLIAFFGLLSMLLS